nr:DMT family transporter [Duganella guangzhouensis]
MLLLCLIWSLQQIGLKATAQDVTPILQIALRSGAAAVLVGLLMLSRRENFAAVPGAWRPGLLAGLLFALEYLLLGAGLLHTSAGHAVVFLYTGPLFAALGLHLKLPSERLAPLQWLGIGLAFAGVATAFALHPGSDSGSGSGSGGAGSTLLGDALCLAAGIAWGATTVVIRSSALARCTPTQTLLYQLVGAGLLLLLAALAVGGAHFAPTPLALANLLFQTIVVSFISLLAWFWLLRHYLASPLGAFSFMTPLFGVMLGALLLGEHINAGFLIGAALVLAGILLVSGHAMLARLLKPGASRPSSTAACAGSAPQPPDRR